jgi:hypothetical protein
MDDHGRLLPQARPSLVAPCRLFPHVTRAAPAPAGGNLGPLPRHLFPYDYLRRLLSSELFFGHESALLLGFLTYNRRFAIAASPSMLHYACADKLQQALPNYRSAGNDQGLQTARGHFPSSTNLKTLA